MPSGVGSGPRLQLVGRGELVVGHELVELGVASAGVGVAGDVVGQRSRVSVEEDDGWRGHRLHGCLVGRLEVVPKLLDFLGRNVA
eukprot:7711957-Lingulodinium_polyedra.AAC.1